MRLTHTVKGVGDAVKAVATFAMISVTVHAVVGVVADVIDAVNDRKEQKKAA